MTFNMILAVEHVKVTCTKKTQKNNQAKNPVHVTCKNTKDKRRQNGESDFTDSCVKAEDGGRLEHQAV